MWSQHCQHFASLCAPNSEAPNLREQFDNNFIQAIDAVSALGDTVTIGADENSDVHNSRLAQKLTQWGLFDPILTEHGAQNSTAAYNRNGTRTPMDAPWVTHRVFVNRCGHCTFDDPKAAPSDHRHHFHSGQVSFPPRKITADCLDTKDPRLENAVRTKCAAN